MANGDYTNSDLFLAALITAIEEHNPGFQRSLLTHARSLSMRVDQHVPLTLEEQDLIETLRQLRSSTDP